MGYQIENHGIRCEIAKFFPPEAERRTAAGLGAHPSAERLACDWVRTDGGEPDRVAGASLLHTIFDRQRNHQKADAVAETSGARRSARDLNSGSHVVLADAAAFEGGTALDCRPSPKSSGACGTAVSFISRFDQERRAGLAHHERRGGCAQSDWNRTCGSCWRVAHGDDRSSCFVPH